jgi:hypothetical protein
MSQQNDDHDGTVIRPRAAPPDAEPAGPADGTDDGLALPNGTRLAEFEITQRIGEGGFSIVYLARDRSLERTVALKEYMPASLAARVGSTQVQPRSQRYRDTFDAGLKSFVNEAKLLAQFDHPSLVKVYRFWEANGTAYMVMPFYQGVTVKEAVRAMPAPPDEAWLSALLAPLTEALLVIHAERCYHRDIAPDNVILLAGSAKPLLLDFGAARRVIGDITQGLTVILKAGYAPVEQYAEVPGMKQGPWTDVYALAAVVYWAITGSTPPASVARMMNDTFVPLTQCAHGRYSARFLQAIDRALAVRPEQRTQTIGDFRQALGLTAEGRSAAAAPRWDDSEATVIRPAGQRAAATTALSASPPPAAVVRALHDDIGSSAVRPRRALIAGSAIGAAAAAAGLWWVLREPSVAPTRQAAEPANVAAPVAPPAAAPAVADVPAAPPAATAPPPEPTPPVSLPAPAPTPPPAPVPPPAAPPTRATRGAADQPPVTTAPATSPAPRGDAARRDRVPAPPAAADNRAECASIMQRLSLGENSPELLDRLKSLKCR